jgi:hypothetical protein
VRRMAQLADYEMRPSALLGLRCIRPARHGIRPLAKLRHHPRAQRIRDPVHRTVVRDGIFPDVIMWRESSSRIFDISGLNRSQAKSATSQPNPLAVKVIL